MRRAYGPKEIARRTYKTLGWGGRWKEAFGDPEECSCWFVSGASASGKSSFVMQLAMELSHHGKVLYLSYEEGVGMSFRDRLCRFGLDRRQGSFSVAVDDSLSDLRARLRRRHSAKFVIVDSFQHAGWSYDEAKELMDDFPRKGFVFVSQEYKGQPMGKSATRLRYASDVKVRVSGFKARCQGRYDPEAGNHFTVWEEGVLRTSNRL